MKMHPNKECNIQVHFTVVYYVATQPLAKPVWLLSPGDIAEMRSTGAMSSLSKHRSDPIKRSKKQLGH